MKKSKIHPQIAMKPLPPPEPIHKPNLTTPYTSLILEEELTPVPPEIQAANFQEALTSIPVSIVHTCDQLFILCHLRRGTDQEANSHLASLHNDKSILTLVPTILTTAFHPHPPQPSISGDNLVIRDMKFVFIKNHTPTYSIAFEAVLKRTNANNIIYARQGTPCYEDMREYVHDFVFEK